MRKKTIKWFLTSEDEDEIKNHLKESVEEIEKEGKKVLDSGFQKSYPKNCNILWVTYQKNIDIET